MIPISNAVKEYLHNNNLYYTAELFKLVLVDGTEIKLTSFDQPYAGYSPAVIERSMLKRKSGLEVQEMEIIWTPFDYDYIYGIPAWQAAAAGALDDAKMEATVVFFESNWTTVVGTMPLFSGWISEVKLTDYRLSLAAKNLANKLAVQVPRGLYTAGCQWRLYDSGCKVKKQDYYLITNVVSHSSRTVIVGSVGGKEDHWFDLGMLEYEGQSFNIIRHVGVTLTLLEEPIITFEGDVTLYPGCDLTADTCKDKFDNYNNFRGFLYIPEPEVAMFGMATTAAPVQSAGMPK